MGYVLSAGFVVLVRDVVLKHYRSEREAGIPAEVAEVFYSSALKERP